MYVILTNNNDMLFFVEMLALYDNLHFYFDKDSCLVFVIQNIFEKRTNKSYQKNKAKIIQAKYLFTFEAMQSTVLFIYICLLNLHFDKEFLTFNPFMTEAVII